jgi:hypothetical protein
MLNFCLGLRTFHGTNDPIKGLAFMELRVLRQVTVMNIVVEAKDLSDGAIPEPLSRARCLTSLHLATRDDVRVECSSRMGRRTKITNIDHVHRQRH